MGGLRLDLKIQMCKSQKLGREIIQFFKILIWAIVGSVLFVGLIHSVYHELSLQILEYEVLFHILNF